MATPFHGNIAENRVDTPGTDDVNHVKQTKRRRVTLSAPLYGSPATGACITWEKLQFSNTASSPPARWGAASCILQEEGEVMPKNSPHRNKFCSPMHGFATLSLEWSRT